jgi:hypothetical protein
MNRKIFIAAAIIAVVFGIGIVGTGFTTNNAGPVQSAHAQQPLISSVDAIFLKPINTSDFCGTGYCWDGSECEYCGSG